MRIRNKINNEITNLIGMNEKFNNVLEVLHYTAYAVGLPTSSPKVTV